MAAAAPGSEFLLKGCGFLARPGIYLAGSKHKAGCTYLFTVELGPGGEGHRQYQAKKLSSRQHPGWHPNRGNAIGQIRNYSAGSTDGYNAADADLLDQGSTDANPATLSKLNLSGQADATTNVKTIDKLDIETYGVTGVKDESSNDHKHGQ